MGDTGRENAGARRDERVVVVTGAARGLGAAISRTLSADGMRIVAIDRDAAGVESLVAEIGGASGRALALVADITDEAAVERAIESASGAFGRIDVLVNNAAIDITVPIDELAVGDWNRVLATNLGAPFMMTRAALAELRRNSGYVVNIASTASCRAWPNASAYHATKWGLLGLSRALHAELRPQGVKVTAIIAGGMRTPFLLDRFPDIDPGLLQDPANVAATVRFALSQPAETVIPELMVLPMRETSWP